MYGNKTVLNILNLNNIDTEAPACPPHTFKKLNQHPCIGILYRITHICVITDGRD